ncbi:MAG: hypothetical protein A2Y38_01125 [Spirochaetes bacterium GWB1_59_5]|nr:MAG: hypothetical protein A2Y38_01125 [Spirochaetes bacterium GWB1_59_5]
MYRGFNGGYLGAGFPAWAHWGGIGMGVLLIAAVVLAIVAVVRTRNSRLTASSDPEERGLEILTERFARGEIDAETFRSMKAELKA